MSLARKFELTDTTADTTVFSSRGWTEVVAKLISTAQGVNRLSFGSGQGYLLEPGDIARFTVGPKTDVKVSTTSSENVEWSFIFTELDYIESAIGLLQQLRDVLAPLVCEPRTDQVKRGILNPLNPTSQPPLRMNPAPAPVPAPTMSPTTGTTAEQKTAPAQMTLIPGYTSSPAQVTLIPGFGGLGAIDRLRALRRRGK